MVSWLTYYNINKGRHESSGYDKKLLEKEVLPHYFIMCKYFIFRPVFSDFTVDERYGRGWLDGIHRICFSEDGRTLHGRLNNVGKLSIAALF